MIQGLDHVAIIVSSEKSISFYEKLGFSIIERIKRNYDEVVFMEIMGLILEIFVDDKHPRRLNQPEATATLFCITDSIRICNERMPCSLQPSYERLLFSSRKHRYCSMHPGSR